MDEIRQAKLKKMAQEIHDMEELTFLVKYIIKERLIPDIFPGMKFEKVSANSDTKLSPEVLEKLERYISSETLEAIALASPGQIARIESILQGKE